jgi:hypothetical protein
MTISSTALGHIPRRHRLPSQIRFNAADSHRYRSTLNVSADAYTAPHQRRYSFISAQVIYPSKKIDRHCFTMISCPSLRILFVSWQQTLIVK